MVISNQYPSNPQPCVPEHGLSPNLCLPLQHLPELSHSWRAAGTSRGERLLLSVWDSSRGEKLLLSQFGTPAEGRGCYSLSLPCLHLEQGWHSEPGLTGAVRGSSAECWFLFLLSLTKECRQASSACSV